MKDLDFKGQKNRNLYIKENIDETVFMFFGDADVIYFTGGNSFFLIDQLRKTGTDELLKKELAKEN